MICIYIYIIQCHIISHSHQTISNYPSPSWINDSTNFNQLPSSRSSVRTTVVPFSQYDSAIEVSWSRNLGPPPCPTNKKRLGKPWSVISASYLDILRNPNISDQRSFGVAIPATILATFYLYRNLSSARLFN